MAVVEEARPLTPAICTGTLGGGMGSASADRDLKWTSERAVLVVAHGQAEHLAVAELHRQIVVQVIPDSHV